MGFNQHGYDMVDFETTASTFLWSKYWSRSINVLNKVFEFSSERSFWWIFPETQTVHLVRGYPLKVPPRALMLGNLPPAKRNTTLRMFVLGRYRSATFLYKPDGTWYGPFTSAYPCTRSQIQLIGNIYTYFLGETMPIHRHPTSRIMSLDVRPKQKWLSGLTLGLSTAS